MGYQLFWCERGDSNPAEKRPKALEIKGFLISIAIFTPEIVLEIPGAVGNISLGYVGIDVVHRAQILQPPISAAIISGIPR